MINRGASLRFRVLAVAFSLVVVGMVLVNLIALLTLRASMLSRVDQELLAVPAVTSTNGGPVRPQLPSRSDSSSNPGFINNLAVTLLDATSGEIQDQITGPAIQDAPAPDLSGVSAAIRSGAVPAGLDTVGGVADPGYRYRIRVVEAPGDASSVLVVARSLADVGSTLRRVGAIDAAVSVGLLLALIAIGRPVMRIGLKPLSDLDQAAARIGQGDLSVRTLHSEQRGEVGHLARTFNEMAERIETAFVEQRASEDRLRRFIADASHELRTPLTSVRAYAELLRQGALPADPASRQAAERIEAEATRMGVLVNDLLLLARLDEQRSDERSSVDLAALVGQLVDDTATAAPTHTVMSRIEPNEHAVVISDAALLHQVVGNLLRNAVVHTPPGTTIEASVVRIDDTVEISVADDGPGMRPEVAEHVFERFYRPEPGRARAKGTGLGLAIVDALSNSLGGSVRLVTAPGQGAAFTVVLPTESRLQRTVDEP